MNALYSASDVSARSTREEATLIALGAKVFRDTAAPSLDWIHRVSTDGVRVWRRLSSARTPKLVQLS